MDVERLIELVRSYTFLYDLSHQDYKNITLKATVWETIGRELNQSGDDVKNKWKTIRDGYTKHKKIVKGTTGSSRKSSSYTWALQLAFLDYFNTPRASSSNVTFSSTVLEPPSLSPTPTCSLTQDPVSSRHTIQASNIVHPTPSTSTCALSQDTVPPRQTMQASNIIQPTPSTSTCATSQNADSSRQTMQATNRTASYRHVTKRSNDDDIEKVLNFLHSKKKRELDGVDHLFLSYADTFKKFPTREQALIKLELAKLFTNTELRLLDYNSQPSPVNISYVVNSPPQPINLSDNSTQQPQPTYDFMTDESNTTPSLIQPINLSDNTNQSFLSDYNKTYDLYADQS